MLELIIAATLYGNISNEYGRIGIIVHDKGGISHVYSHSPSNDIGLERKDIILSCDGVKGVKNVTGIAGTYAYIKIKRGDKIFNYIIPRVPNREVYDNDCIIHHRRHIKVIETFDGEGNKVGEKQEEVDD